jgi:tetratricopeptide repeat protein 30
MCMHDLCFNCTRRRLLKEYEEVLEGYVPVLMSMARIYWDRCSVRRAPQSRVSGTLVTICRCRENYTQVEKIFRQSSEFCNEHPTWRLNVAHVFYMQARRRSGASRVTCDCNLKSQDSPPPGKYREAIRYYEPFIQKVAARSPPPRLPPLFSRASGH